MKKNELLNQWLWKWHFIAGLMSLPVVLILSATGLIYLFKDDYEAPRQKHIREVKVNGNKVSYQRQLEIAGIFANKKLAAMVLPTADNQATEFVSGQFGHQSSYFVDPYTAEVTGTVIAHDTEMYAVRKLHGELLMGKPGTLIVELVGSWIVVLILTGLYVWWPANGWGLRGFFLPRMNLGRRIMFRDLHAVTGFWLSILLLMTLSGGLPWTDVFGNNFKWLQKVTNTGYPATWENQAVRSGSTGEPITLDQVISIARGLNLPGEVEIEFPKGAAGVFSVSNTFYTDQAQQMKIHFDQYSGKELVRHEWSDVGILMRGRMWFMAFHQGQFGTWNWWLMAVIASLLALMSVSATFSYLLRRRKGWDVPKVPASFRVGYGVVAMLIILAVCFPMFGISVVLIVLVEILRKYMQGSRMYEVSTGEKS
jgi:uncharacterized iron-regulated membrane protein